MKSLLFGLLAAVPVLSAVPSFEEAFADPATRAEALATLIPGTRDWYFHHALHQQLSGDTEGFERTISDWQVAASRRENPVDDHGLETLANRELLLRYESDPERNLEALIDTLGLKFDDAKPGGRDAAELPDALDPALVSTEAFAKALANSTKTPWEHYSRTRLIAELDRAADLPEAAVRHLLRVHDLPPHPGLATLASRGLKLKPAIDFGDSPSHRSLTRDQLDELARLHPTLAADLGFVTRRLASLREHPDEVFARDPRLHAAHLKRLREATASLPPALTSLRAHILFHHLRLQFETGATDPAALDDYLAIPRRSHPLLIESKDERAAIPVLDSDFAAITGCEPIGDDAGLLTELLEQALADADSADRFARFIERSALQHLHARARLLHGADPALWGKRLNPSDFAALRDLTLLDFAPGQALFPAAGDAATVTLELKNTPELQIRIHELDLPAILRRDRSEPTAAFDLAGLVPHHARTLTFKQPPLVLHRAKIDLPEITGSGAWIVEFVSGSHACRTLVRRGSLTPWFTRTATGSELRVFDEAGEAVADATLDLATSSISADADGVIRIPDSPAGGVSGAILRRGPLAMMVEVPDRSPDLNLTATIHLDREQLRADATATARLAATLTNHGHELPLGHLENARLTLSARLVSGITTEHVIGDPIKLAPQLPIEFQVPAGATEITFTLSATVRPEALFSGKTPTVADPTELTVSSSFSFNSLLANPGFSHARFIRNSAGHFLELRGRNGEALGGRAVDLEFVHADFLPSHSIRLRLRTADDGRIRLGALTGISRVRASAANTHLASLLPTRLAANLLLPYRIHAGPGETLTLPLDPPLNRNRYSLRRVLSGNTVSDHFPQLSEVDGSLMIAPLPPGDYQLDGPAGPVNLRIATAAARNGLFFETGLIHSATPTRFPTLAKLETAGASLRIEVKHPTPSTRVHLIGTRFVRDSDRDVTLLPHSPPRPEPLRPNPEPCGFLTGRTLDDETRYILDRRAAKTFPGTMLPRPGLLTHRWFDDEIETMLPKPSEGDFGSLDERKALQGGTDGFGSADPFAGGDGGSGDVPDDLDYLDRSSVVRYDLTLAADGSLVIPLNTFEGCHGIDAIVTDAGLLHRRHLPLADSPVPLRDRRLARPLDPAKHHLATRRATVLAKDAEARIENMLDADWRAFTTLAEAHSFLYATTGSERLRELAGMLKWPEFDEASKLAFWTDHACHELHLFLSRRDPGFFAKHVKPTLATKREPAFIDDFLLGRDLTPYLRPFAWDRLNAAEKALLSQALPAARERIAADLAHRWEIEAPDPGEQTRLFTATLRSDAAAITDSLGLAAGGGDQSSAGASYIVQKLRSIIIPVIEFEDTSLEEAVDFLRIRSIEHDTLELDPTRKGMSFVIRNPGGGSTPLPRIAELRLRNVPVSEALNYICEATRMRWSVDEFAITIKPATEVGEDIFTRTFRVPPDFFASLSGGNRDDEEIDPFAPDAGTTGLIERKSLVELLKENGVAFPEGASATFAAADGTLLVRNTASNMDLIEQIVSTVGSDESAEGLVEATGRPVLAPAEAPARYNSRSSWSGNRDQTRLRLEANYDRHRSTDTGESLIPLNAFWLDLARWDGRGPFLSPHFNACTASHNDALMCLALLDLPFTAERPETRTDGPSLRVKARAPMLLFYKDTRETAEVAPDSPVLARQTFHRLDDRFRQEGGRKIENTITTGFRTGIPYGGSLVVTNPTGTGRRIDVLAQIPAGSIPLAAKEPTLAETRELEPYGVLTFDLAFYFPAPGEFTAYPLHVAENGTILTHTAPRTLTVTADDPAADASSWPVIARDGSADEVLAFLGKANLHTIDPDLIAWRMRDRGFFTRAIALLRDRLVVPESLARYGFLHGDAASMKLWLEHSGDLSGFGDFLESPLLDIRPAEHLGWRTLEFDPLVNPRAHALGDHPRFNHDEALTHYREFLGILAWKPALSDEDRLQLTWFLFLQDRIDEAIQRFATIRPDPLANRPAYDYLHTLVLFHQSKPAEAAEIAHRHSQLPPGPWRERFKAVIDQAGEIARLTKSPAGAPPEEAVDDEPELTLESAPDGHLILRHRKLDAVTLSVYQIDLEMLFSRNPFLEDAGELPGTRPNLTRTVGLKGGETRVELPAEMRRGNILVAANAAGGEILGILDSRALDVRCRRSDPVLQVRETASGAPVPAAYVKVYVETDDGAVFHKDGYTDLRGKFDFLTLSDGSNPPAGRIAVLVSHPGHGTRTLVID